MSYAFHTHKAFAAHLYCQKPQNSKVLNREENASICSTESVNGSIGFIAKEMIPPSFLNQRARLPTWPWRGSAGDAAARRGPIARRPGAGPR